MAVAVKMEQRRHLGFVAHQFDQAAPAAWNDEINIVDGMQQRGHGVAVGGFNCLNSTLWQTSGFEPGLHTGHNLAR